MTRFSHTFGARLTLALFAGLGTAAADFGHPAAAAFEFRLALVAQKAKSTPEDMTPVDSDRSLQTGDRFRIFVDPIDEIAMYALHESPEGVVQRLYPPPNLPVTDPMIRQPSYLPNQESWFILTGAPGRERFYLAFGRSRLLELEKIITSCERDASTANVSCVQALDEEIKRIAREHRTMQKTPERPARVGATKRGAEPAEASDFAVTISADEVYVRVVTIHHK